MNSASASWCRPRAAGRIAEIRCSSSRMPGSPSGPGGLPARPSHCSPSSNSPVQIERPGERHQRGCDHRLGVPAVPGGQRDRLIAAPPGHGEGVADRREAEVGEAGHLEIRPADVAGEGGALQQVAFAVGQPQRPRLGDAEIQQRDAPAGRCRARCRHRTGRSTGEARAWPARTRRRSARAAGPDSSSSDAMAIRSRCWRSGVRRRGVRPGRRPGGRPPRSRRSCARSAIACTRASSGKSVAGPGREGPQQRRHRPRLAVEGQAERVVGEQPGRLGPVTGRLQVPDGVGGLACSGEPAAASRCSAGISAGQRAAQFQPEQVGEQVVVAEPGPLGVERHHERVGVLQVQQDPFRARAAPVSRSASSPLTRSSREVRSSRRCTSGGWRSSISAIRYSATVRSLPENSATNRSGSGCPARDKPPAAVRRPSLRSAGAAAATTGSGSAMPGGGQQLAGLVFGEAQVRGADLGQLPGQPELVQAQRQVAAGGQDRMDARGRLVSSDVSCSAASASSARAGRR